MFTALQENFDVTVYILRMLHSTLTVSSTRKFHPHLGTTTDLINTKPTSLRSQLPHVSCLSDQI